MQIRPHVRTLKTFLKGAYRAATKEKRASRGDVQELDIYHDEHFAALLENWADDTAWQEIQVLLGNRTGKVLDLACGSGRAHDFIKQFAGLDYFGCDISSLLIGKAVERGIPQERLLIGDATKLTYSDKEFDYLFSIGSLEHFTVDGIKSTLRECKRVCKGLNFHQIPVSRSGLDEGWVVQGQSYWSNSRRWWMAHFEEVCGDRVWTMTSKWNNPEMVGLWFVTADPDFLASGR